MISIDVCLAPPLLQFLNPHSESIYVATDILRATTSICTAFDYGVTKIKPVLTPEEALVFKSQGWLVAGERDGMPLSFADAGNAPTEFMRKDFEGRNLVFTTTNGTQTILLCVERGLTVIGSFVNLNVLGEWLLRQNKHIVIVCAGWKNRVSLEDTLFAGALASWLAKRKEYHIRNDETLFATSLWETAENDLPVYAARGMHYERLREIGQNQGLEYCFTIGVSAALPVYRDGFLFDLNKQVTG